MNNSIRIKILFLTCSMLCSIPHGFAQTKEFLEYAESESTEFNKEIQNTPQLSVEQKAQIVREFDKLYQKSLDVFRAFDSTLEHIALMIGKNVIKSNNKNELIKKILELRMLVEGICKNTQFSISPDGLYILLRLQEALIEHIKQAYTQGFSTIESFDIDSLIKKSHVPEDLSFDMLEQKIVSNHQQLQQISVDATSIGLTWYNRLFRKLADIDHKYRIFTLGAKITTTGLLWTMFRAAESGVYADPISMPTADNNENKTDEEIKKAAEAAQYITLHNSKIINPEHQTGASWLVHSLGKKIIGANPANRVIDAIPGTGTGVWGGLNDLARKLLGGNMPVENFLLSSLLIPMWRHELGLGTKFVSECASLAWGRLLGGIEQVSAEKDLQILPTISFDDVVGLDNAKQVLSEIVNYIEEPERHDLLGMTPEKGFLLCGPSRTGKSYIAEALAGEIQKMLERTGRSKDDIRFYNIEAQLILKNGMSYLLHLAENTAPCVLFIDEIDLLGLQRAGGNLELLSQFLAGLSGFQKNNPRKKVIILAATNKPENIDEALRKSGRFGKVIHFNYPTRDERRTFLFKKLESLAINVQNFDIEKIVEETEHCTFEDLNKMLSSALKKAKLFGSPLTQEFLLAAFHDEILNIIGTETKDISEEELNILASQIAGRTLAHILLESRTTLNCATIRPVGKHIAEQTVFERLNKKEQQDDSTIVQTAIENGGIFTNFTQDTIRLISREDRIKDAKILLAGNAAEEIVMGSCGFSYKPEDRQKALEIIKKVIFGGLKIDTLSKHVREQYLEECHRLLKQCEQEIRAFLMEHKEELLALRDGLKKHWTLTADQIYKILANAALQPMLIKKSGN